MSYPVPVTGLVKTIMVIISGVLNFHNFYSKILTIRFEGRNNNENLLAQSLVRCYSQPFLQRHMFHTTAKFFITSF